jgi:hypothetical protein
VETLKTRGYYGVSGRGVAEENIVDAWPGGVFIDPKPSRGIALRIEVDYQDSEIAGGQRSGQIDSGGGLSDPALLVGDREYSAQGVILT